MADTQIKQLIRVVGALQANVGLRTLVKNLPEIERKQITGKLVLESLSKLGINPGNIVQQDAVYYSTSWENWQIILNSFYAFIRNIPWVAETGDCDNRASLVTALLGIYTGLNTCSYVHCDRNNLDGGWSGGHLTNVVIDQDGNTYLFDVDNQGMMQKISSQNPVMGREKYTFNSARVF